MGLGYFLSDTFTTSSNEAKRNEYRRLKKDLQNWRRDLVRELEYIDGYVSMSSGADSSAAYGLIGVAFEKFDSKLTDEMEFIRNVRQSVDTLLTDLDARIVSAQSVEDYYQWLCDLEDQENGGWN